MNGLFVGLGMWAVVWHRKLDLVGGFKNLDVTGQVSARDAVLDLG